MATEPAPPLRHAVADRKPLKPGSETVFVDLTLENREATPRWIALRRILDEPLSESLSSALVQACGFEGHPEVHYLQAQSPKGGLFGFHLAPGATLTIQRFAYRTDDGAPAVEVWDVAEVLCDGEPVARAFVAEFTVQGDQRIAEGFRRETRSTHGNKRADVVLQVDQRWTLAL